MSRGEVSRAQQPPYPGGGAAFSGKDVTDEAFRLADQVTRFLSIDSEGMPGISASIPGVIGLSLHTDLSTVKASTDFMPSPAGSAGKVTHSSNLFWQEDGTVVAESGTYRIERIDGSVESRDRDGRITSEDYVRLRATNETGQTINLDGLISDGFGGAADVVIGTNGVGRLDAYDVVERSTVLDDLSALLGGEAGEVNARVISSVRVGGDAVVRVTAFPEPAGPAIGGHVVEDILRGEAGPAGTRIWYHESGRRAQVPEPDMSPWSNNGSFRPVAVNEFERPDRDVDHEPEELPGASGATVAPELVPGFGDHPAGAAHSSGALRKPRPNASKGENASPRDDKASPQEHDGAPDRDASVNPGGAQTLLIGASGIGAGLVHGDAGASLDGLARLAEPFDDNLGSGLGMGADLFRLDHALDLGDDWSAAEYGVDLAADSAAWLAGGAGSSLAGRLDGFGDTLGAVAGLANLDAALDAGDYVSVVDGLGSAAGWAGSALGSAGLETVSSTLDDFVPYAGLFSSIAEGNAFGVVTSAVGMVNPVAGVVLSVAGSVLGGLLGDDDPPPPPEAFSELAVDADGRYYVADAGDAYGGNGGAMAVAAQQAANVMNAAVAATGGRLLAPGEVPAVRIGYDGDGLYAAGRHVGSLDEALGRVAQRMLGEIPIEGGDVHVKRALYGELAGDGALDLDALETALVAGRRYGALQQQSAELDALAGDLDVAIELEALADGGLAPTELSSGARRLLAAREVEVTAEALELDRPHRFDHASRLTRALEQAGVDLAGVQATDLVLALDHGRLLAAVSDPIRPNAAIGALPHAAIDWHADGRDAAMLHLPDGGDWPLADLVGRLTLEDGGGARAVAEAFSPEAEVGTAGDDVLIAGPDGDALHGLAGDDRLQGGAGDDRLVGGAGADLLDGGAGRDTAVYAGSDQGVQVDLAAGAARGGDAWGDRLAGVEDVEGSAHGDVLAGDGGANRLAGGAGDDRLTGGAGRDTLLGEAGDDRLHGGQGDDRVAGGDGDDRLLGNAGDDVLLGGRGDDVLAGGEGSNLIAGGGGRDTAVFAGAFAEHRVTYGSGGDVRVAKPDGGSDRLSGVERLRFDDRVLELPDEGGWATVPVGSRRRTDRSAESAGGWGEAAALGILAGIASRSQAIAAAAEGTPAVLHGEAAARRATVAPAEPPSPAAPPAPLPVPDRPTGGEQDPGAPVGGRGDAERGPPGPGIPAAPPVTPASAGDSRTGRAASPQPLTDVPPVPEALRTPSPEERLLAVTGDDGPASPRELRWEGTDGDDVIRGSSIRDIMYGRAGDDRLFGGWGGDRLYGGPGDDRLHGGSGADLLDGGPGVDVASYRAAASGVSVDLARGHTGGAAAGDRLLGIEWLEGSAHGDRLSAAPGHAARLWGRDGDDHLRGSAADDILDGGAGGDAVDGGQGDDLLLGGNGDDRLLGGAGADALHGSAGADELFGGAGADRLQDGAGADRLDGGTGNDVLWGGNGDDVLIGGAGDDVLAGGAGDDRLVVDQEDEPSLVDGGSGTDTLVLAEPGGWDGDVRGFTGVERIGGSTERDEVIASTAFERIDLGGGQDTVVLPDVSVFSAHLLLDPGTGSARVSDSAGEAVAITAETLVLDEGAVFLDGRNNDPFTRGDHLAGREDAWVRFDPQDLAGNDLDFDAGDAPRVTAVGGVDIALTRGLDDRYWDAAHAEAQADALAAGGDPWQVRRGESGNDELAAGDGDALVLGAGGERDTAVLAGRREDYRLEAAGDHLEVTRLGTGASDRLYGIQGLRFTDGSLFLGGADVRAGVIQITGDGARFRGDRDWFGETSLRYTAGDGRGGQAPGRLTMDIAPVNDSPWLYREVDYDGQYDYESLRSPAWDRYDNSGREGYYAAEGSGRLLGVDIEDTGGGIDVSGALRYELVSQPSLGAVSLSPDGRFSYRLNRGEDAGRWVEEEYTPPQRHGAYAGTGPDTRWVWQPPEDVVHDTDDVKHVSFRARVTDSEGAATESTVTIENSRPRGGGKKPLALDLDGDGLEFTDIDDSAIEADVNGDGWLERMAWIGADDALLTLDRDGDGRVSGFDEISFVDDHPEARTDMQGLALAFDTDEDGDLDRDDAAWEHLALWRDGDGDGVEDRGERVALAEAGIVRIGVVSDEAAERIGDVTVFGRSRFETADGDSGVVGDVAFHFAPRAPGADELAALAAQRVAQAAAGSPSQPLAGAAPAPTPALDEGPVEEPTELAG